MRAVADEGPLPLREGIAHLHALDQNPMAFLALVDRQDVVRPGVARLLHPRPHRWPLLSLEVHEALLERHLEAVDGERSFDFVGVSPLDPVAQVRGQVPVRVHGDLDLADRKAGDSREHVRPAKRHAPGVIARLVERRCGGEAICV